MKRDPIEALEIEEAPLPPGVPLSLRLARWYVRLVERRLEESELSPAGRAEAAAALAERLRTAEKGRR